MNRLTPSAAVRSFCIGCLGLPRFNAEEIRNCQGDLAMCGPCPLFPSRLGRRVSVKVLRKFCLQCQGGDRQGVEDCPTESCVFYLYRFGKNPALTGKRRLPDALRKRHEKDVDVGKTDLESIFIGSEGKRTRQGPGRRLERPDASPGRDPAS